MAHRYFYYVLSKPVLFAKVPLWEFPYRQNEGTSMRTIIEMAREADPKANINEPYCLDDETRAWLEAFAKLVAAAEREACAKLCEDEKINATHYSATTQSNWLAKKIRAR